MVTSSRTTESPLRIGIVAPPGIPCPPEGYGASELVAGNLATALSRLGHHVTLFAHPDSTADADRVSFPEVYGFDHAEFREVAHSSLAASWGDFDILHNHCIAPGPSVVRLAGIPSLTTLHYLRPILFAFPDHPYVAISQSQANALRSRLNVAAVVYNGIDFSLFPLQEEKSDYLLWLGRIDPKKGPHLAIEVAQRLGLPLLLAASYPSRDNIPYWEEQVRPRLGGAIEYIGEVKGAEKARLLGGARCVLMPQQWEEPFGLVSVEAMACGTPVVALRRGALPEVVTHGESGFVVDTVDDMVQAAQEVGVLRPQRCRQLAAAHFSDDAMARGYLAVYRRLLATRSGSYSQERVS